MTDSVAVDTLETEALLLESPGQPDGAFGTESQIYNDVHVLGRAFLFGGVLNDNQVDHLTADQDPRVGVLSSQVE